MPPHSPDVRPSTADVAAAKARILAHVPEAEERWHLASWQTIEESVLRAEALWKEGSGVQSDRRTNQLRLATAEALLQLLAAGSLTPVGSRTQEVRPTIRLAGDLGHPVDPSSYLTVVVPESVRLSARAREDAEYEMLFHPDVYLGRLSVTNAHRRVRLSLTEAVKSFRQESYLAAATMLGSASEGAWLEFFGSLARFSEARGGPKIAVSFENLASKVLNAPSTVSSVPGFKEILQAADVSTVVFKGLVAEYDYLREFRNFSAHFDTSDDFDLSYPVVAGLFLRCTDYFSRLYRIKRLMDGARAV